MIYIGAHAVLSFAFSCLLTLLSLCPLTSEKLPWGEEEYKYGIFLGGRVGEHSGEYNDYEPLRVHEDVADVWGWMKRNGDIQKKISIQRKFTG